MAKDNLIPTPRTNAERDHNTRNYGLDMITTHFAEMLERELHIANKRIKELERVENRMIVKSRISVLTGDE